MEILPKSLENIIYQYKHQMEFAKSLDLIKKINYEIKQINEHYIESHRLIFGRKESSICYLCHSDGDGYDLMLSTNF